MSQSTETVSAGGRKVVRDARAPGARAGDGGGRCGGQRGGGTGARAWVSPGPGSPLWAARYNGPGNNGVAYSVAVSPGGGTVYITGVSKATTPYLVYAYATVAYNAAAGTLPRSPVTHKNHSGRSESGHLRPSCRWSRRS
jgi:hypothetical protein